MPEHLRPELERDVYLPPRAADRVYPLRDLGPAAFHDWVGVHNEFHELALIDGASRTRPWSWRGLVVCLLLVPSRCFRRRDSA